jgi:hypothetical protein
MVALGIGFIVFFTYWTLGDRKRMPRLDLRGALWIPRYLMGLALMTLFGRYDGGRNSTAFSWDLAVLALFSVAIFVLAVKLRLPREQTIEYIDNSDPMVDEPGLADADAELGATRRGSQTCPVRAQCRPPAPWR